MASKLTPLKIINFIIKNDLTLPIILLISYLLIIFFIRGYVPTPEELINAFALFYSRYGYEIIFLAAFLESLILINFVVPGQLAMALGVIFARSGQTDLTTVLITAICGAILGYATDYFLGYYGFSNLIKKTGYSYLLDEAKAKIEKYGRNGLILSFIHTNVGAFASFAAGTLRFKWLEFFTISVLATIVWSVMWGILVYTFGDIFLTVIKKYSFLLLIAFIAWLMLSRIWSTNKKETRS